MEAFLASAEAIAVLIGISAVGFFFIARKMIPVTVLKSLSTLAIEVSVPLYIFSNIIDKFDSAASPGMVGTAVLVDGFCCSNDRFIAHLFQIIQ